MRWVVFISHSHTDRDFVERLAEDLTKRGISVWYDKWELLPGDSLRERIAAGIRQSSFFAPVISTASQGSKWVSKELDEAFAQQVERQGNFILPVLIERCEPPPMLSGLVYADFSRDYRDGLVSLLRVLEQRGNALRGPQSSSRRAWDVRSMFLTYEDDVHIEMSNVDDELVEWTDVARSALRDARDTTRDLLAKIGARLHSAGAGLGHQTIDAENGMRILGSAWSLDGKWELSNDVPAVEYRVRCQLDGECSILDDQEACPLIAPKVLSDLGWTELGVELPYRCDIAQLVSRISDQSLTLEGVIPGPAGEATFRSQFQAERVGSYVWGDRSVGITIMAGGDYCTVTAKPYFHIDDEVRQRLVQLWGKLAKAIRD